MAAVVLGNTIESRIVSAIICCGFLKAFLTLLFSTSSSECDEQEEFGLESSDEEREEFDFLLLCDTRERLDEEEEEEDELESESELSLESSDEDLSDDDVESEWWRFRGGWFTDDVDGETMRCFALMSNGDSVLSILESLLVEMLCLAEGESFSNLCLLLLRWRLSSLCEEDL